MLNEVIKGISMALNTVFGDEYEIRQNDVEQGLVNGSFFIQVLKPELTPLLGRRSMKRNPFDVMYFPKAPGNNAEMFTVAEKLMECLTQISLPNGDLLHGTGMNYEVVDDVLHFMVNFNLTLIRPYEEPYMETLDTDVGTVGGVNNGYQHETEKAQSKRSGPVRFQCPGFPQGKDFDFPKIR